MLAMSDTVWLAVIAGIMLVVKQLLDWAGIAFHIWADRETAKQQAAHLAEQDKTLGKIASQTNGLTAALVKDASEMGFTAGARSEREKPSKGTQES